MRTKHIEEMVEWKIAGSVRENIDQCWSWGRAAREKGIFDEHDGNVGFYTADEQETE